MEMVRSVSMRMVADSGVAVSSSAVRAKGACCLLACVASAVVPIASLADAVDGTRSSTKRKTR